jgi:hypothetical protein
LSKGVKPPRRAARDSPLQHAHHPLHDGRPHPGRDGSPAWHRFADDWS